MFGVGAMYYKKAMLQNHPNMIKDPVKLEQCMLYERLIDTLYQQHLKEKAMLKELHDRIVAILHSHGFEGHAAAKQIVEAVESHTATDATAKPNTGVPGSEYSSNDLDPDKVAGAENLEGAKERLAGGAADLPAGKPGVSAEDDAKNKARENLDATAQKDQNGVSAAKTGK